MIANLVFTKRNDCFCHIKSMNLSINTGTILKITSTLTNNTLFLTCKSSEFHQNFNQIELNGLFAWHSNFVHNEDILIDIVPNGNFNYSDELNLVPLTNDEWDLINKNAELIEHVFLHQICCVSDGMIFPIWVENICVLLKVDSMNPADKFCIVSSATTLTIAPNNTQRSIETVHSNAFPASISKSLYENTKIVPKSTTKKILLRSLYVLFDFFHFLIFGKSYNQKQKECEIFRKWESDFKLNSDVLFNRLYYGRCFMKSNRSPNIALSCLTEPIFIELSKLNCPDKSVFNGKLFLATIEKIPFCLKKSNATKIDTSRYRFTSFVQFSEKSNSSLNSVDIFIPENVWKAYNFLIGDRASCTLTEYQKIPIKKLIFDINGKTNPIILHEIIDEFKRIVGCTQNDIDPLLIREHIQIPLVIRDTNFSLIFKFEKSLNTEENRSYCLLSNYFLRNNSIEIVIENNVSIEPTLPISKIKEIVNLKEWVKDNPLYHELLSVITDNDFTSRNILICGPSGSGKTLFCQKLCHFMTEDENYQYFVSVIDCRDLLGKQPDSVKQKLVNILLEGMWHSPSIICLENVDTLIPNCSLDESNSNQSIHFDCLSSIVKHFYESINKLESNCRVLSISTCKSACSLHGSIMKTSFKNTILFKSVIDMSQINQNVFMKTIDYYLNEMETNKIINNHNHKEILSRLQLKFDVTDNLCGFDAVTITKNAVMHAIKRTADVGLEGNQVQIDLSDLDNTFAISSSYKLSNLNRKKRSVEFHFKDLYGLDEAKSILREIFIWPALYPDLFNKSPIKLQQGLLLYGLPGCGKSYLALALSNEVKMNFRMIKGPELLSKYIGASEEQVRLLFDEARKNQPILLFFDEFDSLAPKRGHDSTGVTDRVVNQLLTEIDGVSSINNSGIFILAASNRPDLIDPAILRPGRISGKIHCELPTTVEVKVKAMRFFLQKSEIAVATESHSIWDFLDSKLYDSQWLQCYSYADLVSVVNQSENNAVMRCNNEYLDTVCEMSLLDFQAAVASSRPSLTKEQITYYLNSYESFLGVQKIKLQYKPKTTLA